MAVSILLALAVVEIFLRLAMPVGGYLITNDLFRLSINPNIVYELTPDSGEVNADGLRDRGFPVKKSPGTFRVMLVGDSIAYGLGVKGSQTYAKVLEKMLNEDPDRQKTFEVINLGVPGYGISQIVERFKEKGLKYDPDLVIYGYWIDDIVESFSPLQKMLMKTRHEAALSPEGTVSKAAAQILMNLQIVRRGLVFYKSLKEQKTRARMEKLSEKEVETRLAPETLAAYRGFVARLSGGYENDIRSREPYSFNYTNIVNFACWDGYLTELAGICRKRHMPCILSMTPLMEGHAPGTYRYRHLHELIQTVAEKKGFFVLDLKDAFTASAGQDLMDEDPEHPNALGHAIIARNMFHFLKSHGLLPEKSVKRP